MTEKEFYSKELYDGININELCKTCTNQIIIENLIPSTKQISFKKYFMKRLKIDKKIQKLQNKINKLERKL